MRLPGFLPFLVFVLADLVSAGVQAAEFHDDHWFTMGQFPGTDGIVRAVAVDPLSGDLYIGGDFRYVGDVPAQRIAKWDGESWKALGEGLSGYAGGHVDNRGVHDLAFDADGNLIVAGGFTTAGGVAAANVAAWDGSAWRALGEGLENGVVFALAVDPAGHVYAAGSFLSTGGSSARYIARWDGTAWSALGDGSNLNAEVRALAVDNAGHLYAGGAFSSVDGIGASRVAKWNGSAWSALGAGMNDTVYALALDEEGNLFAGGRFTTAGSVPANRVAKWDGNAWSATGSGVNGAVHALALDSEGTLFAAGVFITAGGSPANRIAEWNGTAWSALGAGVGGSIRALALHSSGQVVVVGDFREAGTVSARNLARWDGTSWAPMSQPAIEGIDGQVHAVAIGADSALFVAGSFSTIGGVPARNIARWDGVQWSPLGEGLDGGVLALTVDGQGILYAGGSFNEAGGISANRVAQWDGVGWSSLGAGAYPGPTSHAVYALAADSAGGLYAAYSLGSYPTGGLSANVVRWDGSAWQTLGPGMNGRIYALAVGPTGVLYAGGAFTYAGGISAQHIAQWDGTAWSPLGPGLAGWYAGAPTEVRALAVDGAGSLYAGGWFSLAGDLPAHAQHIARWNGTQWSALGIGLNDSGALALAVDSAGQLYVGGEFSRAGGMPASGIARWDGLAWSALGSGIVFSRWGTPGTVRALAADGRGRLYAGGDFYQAGGKVSVNLAGARLDLLDHPGHFRLTYRAGTGGSISGESDQIVASGEAGSPVTAVGGEGRVFLRWSDGQTDNPRTDNPVTAHISVTARFAPLYGGGSGTPENPYRIGSVADWMELIASPLDWDRHFVLVADIDFEGKNLTPVAPGTSLPFSGVLEGAGHVLRNAKVILPDRDAVGLFGWLSEEGMIRNLAIEDITVVGRKEVGGLVGRSRGTVSFCDAVSDVSGIQLVGGLIGHSSGTIADSEAAGAVTGSSVVGGLVGLLDRGSVHRVGADCEVEGEGLVGGLVGLAQQALIEHGRTAGRVTVRSDSGGLVGIAWESIVRDSDAAADVVGEGAENPGKNLGGLIGTSAQSLIDRSRASGSVSGMQAGGLVGTLGGGVVRSCEATGDVEGREGSWRNNLGGLVGYAVGTIIDSLASGEVSTAYPGALGGLVGIAGSENRILWCHAAGTVRGVGGEAYLIAGGLVGDNAGTIRRSYATGTVLGIDPQYGHTVLGGLAGHSSGAISDSYAWGNVQGDTVIAGGLVGDLVGEISNAYAIGAVPGTATHAGGLVGTAQGQSVGAYWNIETSGLTESAGGEGRTTAEMTYPHAENTYAGWDFDTLWEMDTEGVSGGYPLLRRPVIPEVFALAYAAGPGGSVEGETWQAVFEGDAGEPVEAVPATGYGFAVWSDGRTDNPRTDSDVQEDVRATAEFARLSYTVTFDLGTYGVRTGGGELVQSVLHGDAAEAPQVEPNEGWTFTGWDQAFHQVTSSRTVVAQYDGIHHEVRFLAGEHGVFAGGATELSVEVGHGDPPPTPPDVTPNAGYALTHWAPALPETITADAATTAHYERLSYTLTYTAGPGGSIEGSTPQTVWHGEDGEAVTAVPAVPAGATPFRRWSDGRTDNPRTDRGVTGDVTVTAEFAGPYSGGTGTENEPFLIAVVDDWLELISMENDWGRHFRVVADLDFEGAELSPVGTARDLPFSGVLDGGGHTLRNLSLERLEEGPAEEVATGLFGYLSEQGRVANLVVENIAVAGTWHVGGVVGWSRGTLANIRITGTATGRIAVGGAVGFLQEGVLMDVHAAAGVTAFEGMAGGLVGYSLHSALEACTATGQVSLLDGSMSGGLVGILQGGSIRNSEAHGSVSGATATMVGGLVGHTGHASSVIQSNRATGSVSGSHHVGGFAGIVGAGTLVANAEASGSVSGQQFTGGLAGFVEQATVADSRATGNVQGGPSTGGLVGNLTGGALARCYATGDVSGVQVGVGGLVGLLSDGAVSDSYALGSVAARNEEHSIVGGLVGYQYGGMITRTYSAGSVNGAHEVGGLVVQSTSTESTVASSYWNIETSGQTESAGGEGRTTAEMTHPHAANVYMGWDFNDVWVADFEGVNDGYPLLRWQGSMPEPPDVPEWMKPDFVVDSIQLNPQPTSVSETFGASVTVRNIGDIPGDAGVLRVWLSKATWAAAGDTGDAEEPVGTLSVGESRVVTFTGLAAPAEAGTHHFRAFIDADGQTAEKSEGNNQITQTYTTAAAADPAVRPDLAVTALAFVGEAPTGTGEVFTLQVTVENVGPIASAGGTLYFFAHQPTWAVPADADAADASVEVGALNVGESAAFEATLTAPANAGWYHVRGYLVPSQAEWNPGNDQAAVVYSVAESPDPIPAPDSEARPDLAVTRVEFVGPAPTITGEQFILRAVVENVGAIAGAGGTLYFFAHQPTWATPADADAADASVTVGALDVGESAAFEATLTTPAKAGWYHARGYLIPDEPEWNPGNDQASALYGIHQIEMNVSYPDGQPTLTWNNYWGDTYTVYRTTNLAEGFVPLVTGIPSARPDEYNVFVDTDPPAVTPVYYKIGVE